jgi:low-density lipoprotein receptor-related protein 1 (alpha-2-macroglobulin receptor)
MFFTDWNEANPTVQRALFSGLGLKTLISKEIRMPNAIAIDFSSKFLYWSDARLDTIERCDYDGGRRFVVSHGEPSHAFGVAIFGDYLYCKPKSEFF